MRVLIVVEKAKKGRSTYATDLPGCIALGSIRPRTVARMQPANRYHVQGLRAAGQLVPSLGADAVRIEAYRSSTSGEA